MDPQELKKQIEEREARKKRLLGAMQPFAQEDPQKHLNSDAMKYPDFSKEYGALEYAVHDIQSAGVYLPTAIQNYLADQVGQASRGLYNAYTARGGSATMDEFYRDKWSNVTLMNMGLDVSRAAGEYVHDLKKTVAQAVPGFEQIQTVGQAANLLYNSMTTPVLGSAAQLAFDPVAPQGWVPPSERKPQELISPGQHQDLMETNQTMFLGVMEASRNYNPKKGAFVTFAMQSGHQLAASTREEDRMYNLIRGKSLEGGGRTVTDGESGDVLETNSAEDAAQAVSDIGGWQNPPRAPETEPDYSLSATIRNPGKFYQTLLKQEQRKGVLLPRRGDFVLPSNPGADTDAYAKGLREGGVVWGLQGLMNRARSGNETALSILQNMADTSESGQPQKFLVSPTPGAHPVVMELSGNFYPRQELPDKKLTWYEKIAAGMDKFRDTRSLETSSYDGSVVTQEHVGEYAKEEMRFPVNLYTPETRSNSVTRLSYDPMHPISIAPLYTKPGPGLVQAEVTASDVRRLGEVYELYAREGGNHPWPEAYDTALPEEQGLQRNFDLLRGAVNQLPENFKPGGGADDPVIGDNLEMLDDLYNSDDYRASHGFSHRDQVPENNTARPVNPVRPEGPSSEYYRHTVRDERGEVVQDSFVPLGEEALMQPKRFKQMLQDRVQEYTFGPTEPENSAAVDRMIDAIGLADDGSGRDLTPIEITPEEKTRRLINTAVYGVEGNHARTANRALRKIASKAFSAVNPYGISTAYTREVSVSRMDYELTKANMEEKPANVEPIGLSAVERAERMRALNLTSSANRAVGKRDASYVYDTRERMLSDLSWDHEVGVGKPIEEKLALEAKARQAAENETRIREANAAAAPYTRPEAEAVDDWQPFWHPEIANAVEEDLEKRRENPVDIDPAPSQAVRFIDTQFAYRPIGPVRQATNNAPGTPQEAVYDDAGNFLGYRPGTIPMPEEKDRTKLVGTARYANAAAHSIDDFNKRHSMDPIIQERRKRDNEPNYDDDSVEYREDQINVNEEGPDKNTPENEDVDYMEPSERTLAREQQINYQSAVAAVDQGTVGARFMSVAAPLGFWQVKRDKDGKPILNRAGKRIREPAVTLKDIIPEDVNNAGWAIQKALNFSDAWSRVAFSHLYRTKGPAFAARVAYVGHNASNTQKDADFAATVAQVSDAYGLNLRYNPAHPEKFAADFHQLEQSDPLSAQIVRDAVGMPTQGQATATMRKMGLPHELDQKARDLIEEEKKKSVREAAADAPEAPEGEEDLFAGENYGEPPEEPPGPPAPPDLPEPQPKRPTVMGGIVAHGYNGPIYGGGVLGFNGGDNFIGGGNLDIMGRDPLAVNDRSRLRSHNIAGGPGTGSGGGNLTPSRVIMGDPGTGKTHEQVEYARGQASVAKSEKLFLSATRTAKEVFANRVGQVTNFGKNISSFHGLGLKVLKSLSQYGYGTVSQGGEIPDRFTNETILSSMGHYAMTGSILNDMAGTPGVEAREVNGVYNEHFTNQVMKYGDAAELFRSQLMTEADYDTPEFDEFISQQGLSPEVFKGYFTEANRQLRSNQQITMSEMLSIPARFLNANPHLANMLKGFKYVAVDEWNQVGKAAQSLFEHLHRMNPMSTYSISGDKNQAGMWSFLRPIQDPFGWISRKLGVRPENLDKNYRLVPELVSAVGNLNNTPAGDRSVSQLNTNPNVVKRSVKGFQSEDEYTQLAKDIQSDISGGGDPTKAIDPSKMMVIGSNRKQLEAIQSAASGQGLNVWINPSEDKYLDEVFSGRMTWEEAEIRMQEDAANRPDGSVEARTYHGSQGSQADHVYAEVSANNFRGNSPDEQQAAAEKLAVGISRVNGQDGSLNLYSSAEEGGTTPLVDQAFNGTGAVISQTQTPEMAALATNPVPARTAAGGPNNNWAFTATGRANGIANPSMSRTQGTPTPSVGPTGQPTPPGGVQHPARAMLNPVAFASYGSSMASNSYAIRGYSSPTVGSYTTDTQGNGMFMNNGNVTVSPEGVQRANTLAQEAWAHAFNSGPMPTGDPNDFAATLRSRINTFLLNYVKEVEGRVRGTPNELEERTLATHIKELAGQQTDNALGAVNSAIGTSKTNVSRTAHGSVKIRNANSLQQLRDSDATAASKLAPFTDEELLQGEETIISGDNGSYSIGGGRRSGSSSSASSSNRTPSGGLWGGKMGRALYGLYLVKRLWSMTAGPGEQEAEQYETGLGNEYERTAAFGGGVGDNIASRRSVTKERAGLAASQVYGGLSDVGYVMSPSGGLQRMGQYFGLGMGLGSTIFMGAQIGHQMGMLSEAGAAKLGKAGMFVGAETMTIGAGMEIYNHAFQGGRPVMSLGGAGQDFAAFLATSRVRNEYIREQKQAPPNAAAARFYEPSAEDLWDRMRPEEKAVVTASTRRWMGGDTEAERLRGLNDLLGQNAYETVEQSAGANAILYQVFGKDYKDPMAQAFGSQAARLGIGSEQLAKQAEQYASQKGAKRGTSLFQQLFEKFAYQEDLGKQDTLSYVASRQAQLGSQLQALMPAKEEYENLGTNLADGQSLPQIYNSTAAVTGYQMFQGEASPAMMAQLNQYAGRMNQYVGGVVADVSSQLGVQGVNYAASYQLLSDAGMTNGQADLLSSYMGGDIGRMSWEGWKTGNPSFRFYDQAGRSVFQTNGRAANQTFTWWANRQDQLNNVSPGAGNFLNNYPVMGTDVDKASWLFGFDAGNLTPLQSQIVDAYNQGGTMSVQLLQNQKSYENSVAGAGIQMAGIALQENYLWGSNGGGTWDNPTEGSSWGIENRQVALQQRSQRADFAEQRRRMVSQNQFAIAGENIQLQRMNTSNAYNLWQLGFNYQGFQQQEAWTRQDWQFQDQQNAMQFSWNMEDVNEAIRYSSGRQRRTLLRQRDRQVASHNMQEEQVGEQRSRQEQVWARQEEQYKKQEEYTLTLQRLDKENYDLGKRQREENYKMDTKSWERKKAEYEESQKLEEEARNLSREYQHDQLELQKQSAGLQAKAAADAKVFADALVKAEPQWDKLTGTLENMERYEGAFRAMNALQNLMWGANNIDVYKINALIELLQQVSNGQGDPFFNPVTGLDQYGPTQP